MAVTSKQATMRDGSSHGGARIDVHVSEIRQLFNSMDPSPFRERDLDPKVEEYIVESYGELRADRPLCLVVHLTRQVASPDNVAVLPMLAIAFGLFTTLPRPLDLISLGADSAAARGVDVLDCSSGGLPGSATAAPVTRSPGFQPKRAMASWRSW